MNYHTITHDDMRNGDGLRVTLWLAGCDHKCPNCQNPQTWDPGGGILFDVHAKEELFELLRRPYIAGITLSGGDPLHLSNRSEVATLVYQVKQTFPGKSIWLYTGYQWEEICDMDMIQYIDVLVDGGYEEEKKDVTFHWAGSTNQRVIDVQQSLKQNKVLQIASATVLECAVEEELRRLQAENEKLKSQWEWK